MSLPPVPKNWHWAKGTPAGGLHAWLGQLRGRVNGWVPFLETAASRMDELESRSGTSGPITADDVDSGEQPLGRVLTTDGAGGASWTVPTGGELPTPPSVQVFETQAEAQAWEASGPGRVGLYMGTPTPPPGDTTGPTPGTLAASSITDTSYTLTVTGASDASGLHAEPYSFSLDNGQTWSSWRSSSTFAVIARSPGTVDQCRHRVRDNSPALNISIGAPITVPLLSDGAAAPTLAQYNLVAWGTKGIQGTPGPASLTNSATAGQLLVSSIVLDKGVVGTITVPTGWTEATPRAVSTEVAVLVAYKVAAGGEKTVQWNGQTAAHGSAGQGITFIAAIDGAEGSIDGVDAKALTADLLSVALDAGSAEEPSLAIAIAGTGAQFNSGGTKWAGTPPQPTFNDGYTFLAANALGMTNSSPGMAVATKTLAAGDASSMSFTSAVAEAQGGMLLMIGSSA